MYCIHYYLLPHKGRLWILCMVIDCVYVCVCVCVCVNVRMKEGSLRPRFFLSLFTFLSVAVSLFPKRIDVL